MERLNSVRDLEAWQKKLLAAVDPKAALIMVCGGTGCTALGSTQVYEAFEAEIQKRGLSGKVQLKRTGCHGFCEKGPVVVLLPEQFFYPGIEPEDVPEIIEKSILKKKPVERLLYTDPASGKKITYEYEVPFYAKQQRNVFRNNGRIDPVDIADYVRRDGYTAFVKTLKEYSPEQVIEIVTASGLRGRGGGGFPTGVKWGLCRKSPGDEKYLICNADEGDPGAFMDRSLLEGTPHAILEGMMIAGFAVGAKLGIIYVRAEYPLAVRNTKVALEQAHAAGLLGDNILGSGFSFDITIRQGAGAFVCGEETALIASLEGRRGMPMSRPPFPTQKGYMGKPTNINNVETFANVPLIILNGARWYCEIGTEGSKGTKIFALAGRVNNTGLVEVPMGTTLRHIVFDIGGGIPKGRKFKAAQMGGPSGGCIPAKHLDIEIDYDSVRQIGAIMGSGGLIVMDENTCMVDVARYFLEFVQAESCGKCTPCRVGTKKMLQILQGVCRGEAKLEDLDVLEHLAEHIKKGSLCGLGQTAPNPVLSTLRYFRDEYEEHIVLKTCRAAVCEELVRAPCQHACPAGVNVPEYLALAAEGKLNEAANIIRRRNPFVSLGIPEYRLPKKILQKEIDFILSHGIELRTNSKIEDAGELFKEGFKAVFVATGAQTGKAINIEGIELEGVFDALEFLRNRALGKGLNCQGKRIVVLGGGNVAVDTARSAVRLGAKKVTILYRRTREEMPAYEEEIEEAINEGIELVTLSMPKRITGENGTVAGIEFVRAELGKTDADGRRRPIPIEGSESVIECDIVIPAIGQVPSTESLKFAGAPALTDRGTVKVDPVTFGTGVDKIFSGGDCVTGAATVIQAIAAGQKAAVNIDKMLGGAGNLPPDTGFSFTKPDEEALAEVLERLEEQVIPLSKRKRGFAEVVLGIGREQAAAEAGRCLRCDLEER